MKCQSQTERILVIELLGNFNKKQAFVGSGDFGEMGEIEDKGDNHQIKK
jgi:hypothetical protein